MNRSSEEYEPNDDEKNSKNATWYGESTTRNWTISIHSAAGGMVTVEATGTKQINKITINPSVVDPEDVEMLEDVILLALNDALRQVDEKTESTMGQFTKGMNIPGLF